MISHPGSESLLLRKSGRAMNGKYWARCCQTVLRWASGRFWRKLPFKARLRTTHAGRKLSRWGFGHGNVGQ